MSMIRKRRPNLKPRRSRVLGELVQRSRTAHIFTHPPQARQDVPIPDQNVPGGRAQCEPTHRHPAQS
jgi:hypothetical protein